MARKRKGLGQKLRFEIFKRDRFTCQYCGNSPPSVILQVDHIIPVAASGPDDADNLITSCQECNNGKGARDLKDIPPGLKETIEQRRERSEQVAAYNAFLLEQRERENAQIEFLGLEWFNRVFKEQNRYVFGSDRVRSIRTFLKYLTSAEILDAIEIAHGRVYARPDYDIKTWRYFCGVCWRKIRERNGEQV